MTTTAQSLRLDIQFDRVASTDATETVSGATSLPEFSASCSPDIGHVSCTGEYEGCGGSTGQPEEDPQDEVCIDG